MQLTESTWFVIAIIIYLFAMLAIGFWAYRKNDDYSDYMLGGRDLPPFVAAMSAGASDMSGWLLMGLPGALFVSGFSELWIAVGLAIGAWANWKWVAPRLRAYTEIARNSITMPSFFENRLRDRSRLLRIISSVIIIFFFTFYISSGMVSGGRYFESTFDGDYLTGLLIVAGITVAYTFIGGFLAVSYTDTVQAMMMVAALVIVPVMALVALDDPMDIFGWQTENAYGPWPEGNPEYFNMFTGVSAAVIIGNLAWGLGYLGQPHILVRFMALRNPRQAVQGRRWNISWMVLTLLGGLIVAMVSTVYFGQKPSSVTDQTNYETVFLDLTRILFHPLIAGLVLTAVLAAIMSTMSSQLLVVSSSLIEDLTKIIFRREIPDKVLVNLSRTAVVAVAIIAAMLAIVPKDSILGLVGFAWAGFGSAFGPLVVAMLYWRRLTSAGAIAGMITGAVVSVAWSVLGLSSLMYELVPGFLAGAVALVVVSLLTREPSEEIRAEFDAAVYLAETGEFSGAAAEEAREAAGLETAAEPGPAEGGSTRS